jgi:hypothetical protein
MSGENIVRDLVLKVDDCRRGNAVVKICELRTKDEKEV